MAIANANAEASSSQTNNNAPNSSQNALSRMASPPNTAVSSLRSPPPTGRTTASSRKVRTVPPSAAYEPDTPDSSHPNSLPSATAPTTAATNGTFPSTSSRRHRKLYSRHSSGSSGGDSDDESDGEAPFWAFTTHGKAKIRSRMIKGQGGTSTPPQSSKSTHLNVFSGLADVGRFSRRGSRQNSTDKETFKRQPSPDAGKRRSLGDLAAPRMILDPPIRQSSTNSSPPRRKKRVEINAPAMSRSTSEPSSPVNKTINLPSSEPQLQPPPPIALSGNQSDPTISQQSQARKKLTPIQTRFLRRPELGEAITDSETGDELRRPKPRGFRASTLNISGSADDTDGATSRRAAIKKQASKLKANLAPQVSQHFNGWPQAGSWQDVYYGIHDEPEPMSDPGVLRPGRSNKPSSKPSSLKNIRRDRFATPDNTDHEMEVPSEAAMRKKNRQRRYRHALSPPTPSGLGFEPKDNGEGAVAKWKEGRIGPQQNGFDWSQGRREGTIDEGQEDLSRAPTNITGLEAMNEKTGAGEGVTQVPRRWYTSRAKRRLEAERGQRFEHIPIKKKLRRMLFLDARVTIWIRALNLAVVIASLALAVSIRLKLDELLLPGLIGSSTTLIIAYSSLTAFHVLTAIYREYFGRPIGLWGLRQKMLWVCLDLIFIGLWSSALSIATNDYIATPLDCTPDTPWWRGNLADHYAMLVARLAANDPNSTSTLATHAITPVEMIAQSLGISLPVEVLQSPVTREICEKQEGSIALALLTLLLYTINMVLSLFRIFETVRRTMGANDKILV